VNATYTPPSMPWIDPKAEAIAWAEMERAGFASGPEIIRKRGRSPADVLRESQQWQAAREEAGLPLNQDAAPMAPAETEQEDQGIDEAA
jgi:capsid protein